MNTRRAGFTLVEMAVVAAILAIALASLALFGRRSALALRSGATQSDLDARLQSTLVRISKELLPSGFRIISPTATPPEGISSLEYRKSGGAVNGTLVWGQRNRIAFEFESGELDDGLDNNDNGLVDEGVVTWTVDVGQPGELRTVVCHGVREHARGETANGVDDNGNGLVDERGLSFERTGEGLCVRLTVEDRDPEGRPLTRALETEIQPRN